MSSDKINVLLTGASGYIGGSVLTALLHQQNASQFHITTLVRGDESRVKRLASLGVTPLLGSNDSKQILEKAASESHVVIHTGNSADDLPSTSALISGLNTRIKMTGQPAIYIHTSGTGVILEDTRGKKGSDVIYNDLNPDQINGLPDSQIHRDIDLFIANAGAANPMLKTAIVIPPTIYGIGTGPFHRTSIQFPTLLRAAMKRGKAEIFGPGEATWDNVHVADLADAYVLLVDRFLAAYGPDAQSNAKPSPYLTSGREGYYFAENGRHSWRQLAEKMGEILYRRGLASSSEVTNFPDGEGEAALFGPSSWIWLASQANSKADRLRKLGWKPHRASLFDSIEEQLDAFIEEDKN